MIEYTESVGFITVPTDGMQSAFIPLLEVLPEYWRRGMGSARAYRMMERLMGFLAIDATNDSELLFEVRYGSFCRDECSGDSRYGSRRQLSGAL